MTRLTKEHVKNIKHSSNNWDRYLKEQIGHGLVEIASAVSGVSVTHIKEMSKQYKVAVIPVTSGLGTIELFSDSVAAILKTIGFNVYITDKSDVDGLYEARMNDSDIVFMADDNRFIALNLRNYRIAENNYSTANGFVELLEAKEGDLGGRQVLVIGYGQIGRKMVEALQKKNAVVTVYDKDQNKLNEAAKDGFPTIHSKSEIKNYELLADASSEGDWLKHEFLNKNMTLVTPGVPLSLTQDAQQKFEGKYFHDHLEIGTSVMIGSVL